MSDTILGKTPNSCVYTLPTEHNQIAINMHYNLFFYFSNMQK
jgi:hypothetical protein